MTHQAHDPAEPAELHPLYADARRFGLKLTTRVKLIVVGLVIIVGLGCAYLYASNQQNNARHDQRLQDQHEQQMINQQTADQLSKVQTALTAVEQVLAQTRTERTELACYIRGLIPAGSSAQGDTIRAQISQQFGPCPPA